MNTGGPAFPHGPLGDSIQFKDGRIAHQWPGSLGMDLIDWFAGQEDLADWDIEGAIIPANLATHFGGDMPQGGWSENPVAAFERDARIRAGMKYARAEAMLAEKARREGVVKGSSMTEAPRKTTPDEFHQLDACALLRKFVDAVVDDSKNVKGSLLWDLRREAIVMLDRVSDPHHFRDAKKMVHLEEVNRELVEALSVMEMWVPTHCKNQAVAAARAVLARSKEAKP